MNIKELYARLEERLPPLYPDGTDSDGCQCMPEPERKVRRVLVTLDPYGPAVREAISRGADLLLTHHPLMYGEQAPGSPAERWYRELTEAGVAQFSFHMRLDAAAGGVSDLLARALGLTGVSGFGPEDVPGIGRIGTLPSPMTAKELARVVGEATGAPVVRYVSPDADPSACVRRVAVLGGSASSVWEAAAAAGAEILVGGEFKHHVWGYAPGAGLGLVEAGHYYTEFGVCDVLAGLVRALIPDCEVEVKSFPPAQLL